MKKFELYMGIAMMIITTVLIILFPLAVEYSNEKLALISLLSAIGYVGGYLLIDSFICRVETHYYLKGYDECLDEIKDTKVRFNLSKNSH
jgi:hypothetical protein